MIDRYARDALTCYGRLRQLDPAGARAELELFEQLLVIPPGATEGVASADGRPGAAVSGLRRRLSGRQLPR